jgi:AmmeMemoRadiSam system protein A
MVNPFVDLAYKAIKSYLETGQILPLPHDLSGEMLQPAAVFVSLHLTDGRLRGCRGTIAPTEPTLAEAIIRTAIASAVDDPRFPPMVAAEIAGLQVKVDILSPMELVTDVRTLNVRTYGVLIQSGQRRALLLPDIEMVQSVDQQLTLVRRKAGLSPEEPAQLYRFTVIRHQ